MSFVASTRGNKSHHIISDALTVLESMEHRGASGAENNSGDGAGIMTQIPHEFFFDECLKLGVHLPGYGSYGVGILFFPKEIRLREECRNIFNSSAEKLGLEVLAYRKVPVNPDGIGSTALSIEPEIEQVFIARPDHITNPDDFERKLFVLRNYATHLIQSTVKQDQIGFYVCSLSYKLIVYKGQLTNGQLRGYFPDLSSRRYVSCFGMVHSRFATKTEPRWNLAQPLRYLSHKGEIIAADGSIARIKAAELGFTSPYFTKEEMEMILPVIGPGHSDSSALDNIIELLTLCGRSLPHAMMMLLPEAWDGDEYMDPLKKAFYEYHASLIEPWDGPAFISFTDGSLIGAMVDRNGLRPSRYYITNDDRVIMAPETGVLPVQASDIIESGRLQPGKMFLIDFERGRIISDDEFKTTICSQKPYAEWLNRYKIRLEELPEPNVLFTHLEHEQVFKYQKTFGYTKEDLESIIAYMAITGEEPIGSMGNDTPLAVLSEHPQHLSSYFKQLFAQIIHPSIDPVRERELFSLTTFLGNNYNLLVEDPLSCHCIGLRHPILTNYELEKIRSIDTGVFQAKTLQLYFRADGRVGSLNAALSRLCRYAIDAVEDGYTVLILSDRAMDSDHAPIPSLLATAAVYHYLNRKGLYGQIGLIVEAGDIWEVHHFSCLIGFGATAINPYLALSSIRDSKLNGKLNTELDVDDLRRRYIHAVNNGLLKIFSKMGVSTLQSYQGAQLFELLGINKEVTDRYFTGAISRIEGMGLDEIAREALAKHTHAFTRSEIVSEQLQTGGNYQWRRKGEAHAFTPETIHLLQYATRKNDYAVFKKYTASVDRQTGSRIGLRNLLQFRKIRKSISIDEVESPENIFKRFSTGAMSLGSLSFESHSSIAIAMNRLGGKSNCGEGGEVESLYRRQLSENGDSTHAYIKQVASARFGVTTTYLTGAEELQIKISQGSMPGEGGLLPGSKVDSMISKIRKVNPGIDLLSPSSQQDVSSVEDLAQLIYDLKNANRHARISVKLVSTPGISSMVVATVKAKADAILISGYDGGTGASFISSTRHAGLPWELGLAEAQQALVKNKLRSRVVLQVDGQLKTARDIAIAILLGAEEWSISTAVLIAQGCIMTRKCHLNTCPVGIATQDPDLRKRFNGDADHVINFFKFLTHELREIMAEMGFRTVDEMVGQVEHLEVPENISHWKYKKLDLSPMLYKEPHSIYHSLYNSEKQHIELSTVLDWRLLNSAAPVFELKEKVKESFLIRNTDRTVGTVLSNEVLKKFGADGLSPNSIHFKFTGTAGQSFGAFVVKGITLELEGDANDFFGKGLSGGKLIAYPNTYARFVPEENTIIGNVAFYGATSGEAYIRGRGGERFCSRNSGLKTVIEGIGNHGCEYMSSGTVVVLGDVGRNFAAGMTGGTAFVYDIKGGFVSFCNKEFVELLPVNTAEDTTELTLLLQQHYSDTKSTVARFVLDDFDNQLKSFVKVRAKKSHLLSQTIEDDYLSRSEEEKDAGNEIQNITTDPEPLTIVDEEESITGTIEPLATNVSLINESDEIKRLKQEISELKQQKEAPQKNDFLITIGVPDNTKTALAQYLLYLRDFITKAKGVKAPFEIKVNTPELTLEFTDQSNDDQITAYVIEYINFIESGFTQLKIENLQLNNLETKILELELRNQIRALQASLEVYQLRLNDVSLDRDRLYSLLDANMRNNKFIINVKSESTSNAEANATANAWIDAEFNINLQEIRKDFLNFKNEFGKIEPDHEKELATIDEELLNAKLNDKDSLKPATLNRIKRILEIIDNEKSTFNKIMRTSKKCISFAQKLASTYNKFAKPFGLPHFPDMFLNKSSD